VTIAKKLHRKMESENMKIDTEKIETLRVLVAYLCVGYPVRPGEGTGAPLAMHFLEASARILCEMATFDSAGISGAIHAQG